MRAAVAGAKGSGMRVLAVTVLTSYDDADLFEAGYRFGVVETVRRRAEQALALGVDGLVASAEEAAGVGPPSARACFSSRPASARRRRGRGPEARRDPGKRIRNGADYLVVGRPITPRRTRARPPRRSSPKSPQPRLDRPPNGAIFVALRIRETLHGQRRAPEISCSNSTATMSERQGAEPWPR